MASEYAALRDEATQLRAEHVRWFALLSVAARVGECAVLHMHAITVLDNTLTLLHEVPSAYASVLVRQSMQNLRDVRALHMRNLIDTMLDVGLRRERHNARRQQRRRQ